MNIVIISPSTTMPSSVEGDNVGHSLGLDAWIKEEYRAILDTAVGGYGDLTTEAKRAKCVRDVTKSIKAEYVRQKEKVPQNMQEVGAL